MPPSLMETHREIPASLYLLFYMTVISVTSASAQPSMTACTSSETQPCFQSVNNIHISTHNDSATQGHDFTLSTIEQQMSVINDRLLLNNQQLSEIIQLLNQSKATQVDEFRPRDCLELQRAGFNESGQYKVYPDDGGDPFFAFCDMETDGGGWTVFQRRKDGTVDFYQNWQAYKTGFGPVYGEHWLGNDRIHRLTSQKKYALRVNLWDWEDQSAYAQYNTFYAAGEDVDFLIVLGQYSGTAGGRDSMGHHNGKRFSTHDADNDIWNNNCAERYHGAWWYGSCIDTCLNGRYYGRGDSSAGHADGIIWEFWKGNYRPLKASEMKIRPV